MFIRQRRSAFLVVGPDDEFFFRLPPMSNGVVNIKAFREASNREPGVDGPGKVEDVDVDAPPPPPSPEQAAKELELELLHSNHLSVKATESVSAVSLWHDDLWRLRVRRKRGVPVGPGEEPRGC